MKKESQSKNRTGASHKESVAHYNAVLIEELKSDFRFVIEGLEGFRSEVSRRFEEQEAQNQADFDSIKIILKQMIQRFERIDQRFERMDQRFDTFELKFDRVAEKVEGHDQAIQHLKTMVH